MKAMNLVKFFVIVGVVAWIVARVSPEAIGMGVGVVLGVLASVPTIILMIASERRWTRRESELRSIATTPTPTAPIVVIINEAGCPPNSRPDPRRAIEQRSRGFRVVGEDDRGNRDAWAEAHSFKVVGEDEW